ncbi:hypothetical protein ACFLXM_00270 [Chloroflexota bacterium]
MWLLFFVVARLDLSERGHPIGQRRCVVGICQDDEYEGNYRRGRV